MKYTLKKLASIVLATAMVTSMFTVAHASESNHLVDIALWNANSDQPSMGNVATDNNVQALYNPSENTLQFATNPVDVSGYCSGIQSALYDTTGKGDFQAVTTLSTGTVETGTKNDGTNHTVTFLSSFEIEVPSYLTMEGVEYIPFQMSVPYTPMDVVVGTGYLDARIRIDWDTMTTTDLTDLVPNTEISTGEVEEITLTSSGVTLNAESTIVSSDALFTVTKVTSGSAYNLAVASLAVAGFDLYEVSLTVDGADFELTGSVNLTFPYSNIPTVYRINDDATKTTLRGLSSAEGYLISTRSMGLYAVLDGVAMEVVEVPQIEAEVTPEVEVELTFADIAGHWAEDYIITAVNYGMFNGTSTTTFSPEAQMTNGMVITVLHRLAGEPEATHDGATWYSEAMAWGYENEMIGGYTDFAPEGNVTREGLATMLYRYQSLGAIPAQGADLSSFTDSADISDWALDALAWANAKGIVNGTTSTTIAPQSEATRAQVATMLCRYVDGVA